jgi:hypothetical protein
MVEDFWIEATRLSKLNLDINCLDVPGGNRTNGTPLQVWDCGPKTINKAK